MKSIVAWALVKKDEIETDDENGGLAIYPQKDLAELISDGTDRVVRVEISEFKEG